MEWRLLRQKMYGLDAVFRTYNNSWVSKKNIIMDMTYHSLLSEPLLVYDNPEALFGPDCEGNKKGFSVLGLAMPRGHPDTREMSIEFIADSLEMYLRKMISTCALRIRIPAHGRSMWASSKRIKSLLSPSAKKRLIFVDHKQSIWACIENYFRCVYEELPTQDSSNSAKTLPGYLASIAWDLYLLALAAKFRSEAPLNPQQTMDSLDSLLNCESLSRESKVRLSVARGIFAAYSKIIDIPAFSILATATQVAVRERLSEILEDAYLLEASYLKRFISIKSNVASIKRDLRKLIKYIAGNRKWAKGLVGAASQSAVLSSSSMKAAEMLTEIFPDYNPGRGMPTLIDPNWYLTSTSGQLFVSYKRVPFTGSQDSCSLTMFFRPLKEESTQPDASPDR